MNAGHEDARVRRRDRASIVTGAGLGAGLGALAGLFGWPAQAVCAGVGAMTGAALGRLVAPRISPDDWDPPANDRSYVGLHAPDDDIATG